MRNAAFRSYTFETFGARVPDMESAAVAHVAWANRVPFIAMRSLSDLAGGSRRTPGGAALQGYQQFPLSERG